MITLVDPEKSGEVRPAKAVQQEELRARAMLRALHRFQLRAAERPR